MLLQGIVDILVVAGMDLVPRLVKTPKIVLGVWC